MTNTVNTRLKVHSLERRIHKRLAHLSKQTVLEMSLIANREDINPHAVIDTLDAEILAVKMETNRAIQPRTVELEECLSSIEINEARARYEKEKEALIKEKRNVILDMERVSISYDWQLFPYILSAIILLGVGDIGLNFGILQFIVPNFVWSGILVLAIGLGIAFVAHTTGTRTREAKTTKAKIFNLSLGFLTSSAVFLTLGYFRMKYYQSAGEEIISPLWWYILNIFLFALAVIVAYKFMPLSDDWEELRGYKKLKKKLEAIIRKEKKIDMEQVEKEKEYKRKMLLLGAWNVYRQELHKEIDSNAHLIRSKALKEYHFKSGKQFTLNEN